MKAAHAIVLCAGLALSLRVTAQQDSIEKVQSNNNDPSTIHGYPIHEVNPNYPGKPRKKKKASGRIVLLATVAPDGSVKDVFAESGDPSLVPAAIEAVRQWRYLPDMRNGSAIESQTQVTLEYDLGKHASRPENPAPGVPTTPAEDLLAEIAARGTSTGLAV